jgi:hypothetical protein
MVTFLIDFFDDVVSWLLDIWRNVRHPKEDPQRPGAPEAKKDPRTRLVRPAIWGLAELPPN